MSHIRKTGIILTIQAVLFLLLFSTVWAGPFEDAEVSESRQDYAIALKLYRQLAEQGHAQAMFKLGRFYTFGYGVAEDKVEAFKWFYKSAELGYAKAQFAVGVIYANRILAEKAHITKEPAEAFKWVRKAAEQGYPNAQLYLAGLYSNGFGTPKDPAEGDKWTLRAAKQGNSLAQLHMGWAQESGASSFPQDNVKAYMWYSLSAAGGDKRAPEFLDKIIQKMTPEQIAEAKSLVSEWKPQMEQ